MAPEASEDDSPTHPAVDFWVNLAPPDAGPEFLAQGYGIDPGDDELGAIVDHLLADMDANGVEISVLTAGLTPPNAAKKKGLLTIERLLQIADEHPGRFLVSAVVDQPERPVLQASRVRELAQHPKFSLVRVIPLLFPYPLNDRLYYPVYATCAELNIPVSVNVGIPGPRTRSAGQDPVLLEDLLIDFRGMTIIAAHMGHPYEELLLTYMRKWRTLYLSNSAYLAGYMEQRVLDFMESSQGRTRVLFGSDYPFLPLDRAVASARGLDISPDAAAAFLGDNAKQVLIREG